MAGASSSAGVSAEEGDMTAIPIDDNDPFDDVAYGRYVVVDGRRWRRQDPALPVRRPGN